MKKIIYKSKYYTDIWNKIALVNKLSHAVKADIITENDTIKVIDKDRVISILCKNGTILINEEYKHTDVEDAADCIKYLLE